MQEPLNGDDIKKFCKMSYSANYSIYQKCSVNGKNRHPLYKNLISQDPKKSKVSWNFEKFLIDRKGNLVDRFSSSSDSSDIKLINKIKEELAK